MGSYITKTPNCSRLFILLTLLVLGGAACAALKPKKKESFYTWASFFNKGCGPVQEVVVHGDGTASLAYHCSDGNRLVQHARLHNPGNAVGIWMLSRLDNQQLYELSNSKCQASVMYLAADHATIKFPCALVHLTVEYDVSARATDGDSTRIELKPTKVLITYGDGIQEFVVTGDDLIPKTPFKPFPARKPQGEEIRL